MCFPSSHFHVLLPQVQSPRAPDTPQQEPLPGAHCPSLRQGRTPPGLTPRQARCSDRRTLGGPAQPNFIPHRSRGASYTLASLGLTLALGTCSNENSVYFFLPREFVISRGSPELQEVLMNQPGWAADSSMFQDLTFTL